PLLDDPLATDISRSRQCRDQKQQDEYDDPATAAAPFATWHRWRENDIGSFGNRRQGRQQIHTLRHVRRWHLMPDVTAARATNLATFRRDGGGIDGIARRTGRAGDDHVALVSAGPLRA